MPLNFQTSALPPLFFGAESLIQLPRLALAMGNRVLLVHGISLQRAGRLDSISQMLVNQGIVVTSALIEGEPTVDRINIYVNLARSCGIQGLLAIGGGSVLDAGKAIAALVPMDGLAEDFLEGVGTRKHTGNSLPWLALPTTAGTGSEATCNAVLKGIDANGIAYKRSIRHPNFLPRAILIDASWQIGIPQDVTASCAMDAFSQLLEAYTSTTASSLSDAIVWQGLTHMAQGLARLRTKQDSLEMREHFALAALCSGFGLANAGLGLVHGVAGLIGARREIPHGVVCGTLVAPAFTATISWLENHPSLQATIALAKFSQVAQLLHQVGFPDKLPDALHLLVDEMQIARLSKFGFTTEDLHLIAQQGSNRNSPANIGKDGVLQVLISRL